MPGPSVKLYQTAHGPVASVDNLYYLVREVSWDNLFTGEGLRDRLLRLSQTAPSMEGPPQNPLAPIGTQEVWAAGVTYFRSKRARMEESGEGDFYDRVYVAARPELFFKASPHRVSGPDGPIRIRRDARWSVPEPELALAVNASGIIFGYTIGNDVSARDIEGENPLYLPQAKVYNQCCGLGPALFLPEDPLPLDTVIHLCIRRNGAVVVEDHTALTELRRSLEILVEYLFRDNSFPAGCYLLTGTGIVPPDAFTLEPGDRVHITIDPIGTLENYVVQDHD